MTVRMYECKYGNVMKRSDHEKEKGPGHSVGVRTEKRSAEKCWSGH